MTRRSSCPRLAAGRALGGAVLLSGCVATLGGIRERPLDDGEWLAYAASHNEVIEAARGAVLGAGLEIAEEDPVDERTWMILAEERGIPVLDWGTIVRVVVETVDERRTVVRVVSRDREHGWEVPRYAETILGSIGRWLARDVPPDANRSSRLAPGSIGRC